MLDQTFDVTYICYPSGAGTIRLKLSELPAWLERNKGAMITELRNLSVLRTGA